MATINGDDRNNVLPGTSEADTINGFGGNDILHGYAGDDTLNGGAGDDTLYGYEGADTLNGDAGDDLIFTGRPDLFGVPGGEFGSDVADGGDGYDTVVISWYNQLINGQYISITLDFGNGDFVVHGGGSDWETAKNFEALVYYGSDGGDIITGSQNADFIQVGYGADVVRARGGDDHIVDLGGVFDIDGGDGIDTLELPTYLGTEGVTLRLQPGGTALLGGGYSGSVRNVEILAWDYQGGTPFNDYYEGGAYGDEIHAGAGNDLIYGGAGNDKLYGGRGDDTIYGGTGDDSIEGGGFMEAEGVAGSDTIYGGDGNDSIEVDDRTGTTYSYLYGEAGDDSVSGYGHLEGGDGNDRLGGGGELFGGPGDDTLYGSAGSLLNGGDGNDTLDYRRGANYGGEGPGNTVVAPLIVDLAHPDQNTFVAQGSTFVSIENIIGSLDGPNDLRGDDGPNRLTGGLDEINWLDGRGGDDTLIGDSRPDILKGGAGFDTLIGRGGNDILDGGANPSNQGDIMLGGAGDDTYHVDSTLDLVDEDFVFPGYGHGGTDTVISTANWYWDVESVGEIDRIAENAADPSHAGVTFVGGVFDNVLYGHSGTDILFGRGGNDTYIPGDGVDWISLSTLGLTDQNAYAGVDGHNTIIATPRTSGAVSYDIMFEFDPARDKVDVSAYGSQYASGADVLSHAVNDGAGNSYIALGDGLDYLYFVGLTKDHLLANDFVV